MHCVQNRLHDGLVPHSSVDHEVVERTRGPVGVEVVLDVGDALAIDGIDHFRGVFFAMSFHHNAAEFLGARSI